MNKIMCCKYSIEMQSNRDTLAAAGGALEETLATLWQPHCCVILILDGRTSASTVYTEIDKLWAPWGVGVLEVAVNTRDANLTQLVQMVEEARKLRQLSWCVTVVVVSDDPVFLATFAEWSLKGRLLLWSTRLLVLTRLPLQQLQGLQKTFAMTNAMLLIVEDYLGSLECSVYLHLPYTPEGTQAMRVASWAPRQGLFLTTHLQLFPNKFFKLLHRPKFVVTAEESEPHIGLVRDGNVIASPLSFKGPMVNVLNIFATTMNFTYRYVRPPDRSWGIKLDDGTWTGMVGIVGRKEADFGLGPYDLTALRAEVVDFTSPVLTQTVRIVGARGRPEVDPWGFLMPLTPLVWATILTTLLVLPLITLLLSTCSGLNITSNQALFSYTRVLFQQDNSVPPDMWWERLVLGAWMMMTLVLTRSYAGNLMSFLAVRHISQPYQSFRHVMDDPSVTMIWMGNSSYVQYFRSMKSGVFREIADSEKKRIKYIRSVEYYKMLDSLVREGDHVIVTGDQYGNVLMARDFSHKGRCDFYLSSEGYMPAMSCMIVQKDSPLVPVMTKRYCLGYLSLWQAWVPKLMTAPVTYAYDNPGYQSLLQPRVPMLMTAPGTKAYNSPGHLSLINLITQAGLYQHWVKAYMPNSTSCVHPPTKVAVNTSLTIYNLWGMFVMFFGGHGVSLLVLSLELLVVPILQHVTS
ncbi:uncharacterized protein [Panulirus ornatus]|uniref:uncharacterized protein n=1 Tax=Panulirus ornatus TaxID=150431 RepID=UPI003A8A3A70